MYDLLVNCFASHEGVCWCQQQTLFYALNASDALRESDTNNTVDSPYLMLPMLDIMEIEIGQGTYR